MLRPGPGCGGRTAQRPLKGTGFQRLLEVGCCRVVILKTSGYAPMTSDIVASQEKHVCFNKVHCLFSPTNEREVRFYR